MPKFKMIGRDINAPPVLFGASLGLAEQDRWEAAGVYRTWIVDGYPDYAAAFYTGLKSGDKPLIDIVAYQLPDGYIIPDGYVADFNFPDPLIWETTKRVLPVNLYDSSLAIIGNYAYLFGGNGGQISDKILRANINTPVNWVDTGATLPAPLYASQLAIIDGYIYLFGGGDADGYSTDAIYKASVTDPLSWIDTGAKLPDNLNYSQLSIIDGYIYLFGGQHETYARAVIFKAAVTDPLTWVDTGVLLPQPMYGHQLCVTDGYVFLVGGLDFNKYPMNTIYWAPLTNPTNFTLNGTLPLSTAFGQMAFIGDRLYYIGGYGTGGSVLQAKLSDPPLTFVDKGVKIPGTVTHSQLAIIYDRLFLLGGNGSTIIWAAGNLLKYNVTQSQILTYGDKTRTQYDAIPNVLDLFNLIGFPPWKTDYGSY